MAKLKEQGFFGYLKRNPLFVVALVLIGAIDTLACAFLVTDVGIRLIVQPIAGAIAVVPVIILWMKFIDPV